MNSKLSASEPFPKTMSPLTVRRYQAEIAYPINTGTYSATRAEWVRQIAKQQLDRLGDREIA